ncbi:MAG TPA: tRNA (adenosine(37)-N6)-threonylcarbamoyltransferase complex ATPase subunit type 1 TsaE [Candidatus Paceibacterota bacterium]|nr:tRNA (adenosine(37)-N6)-threonylcarbamoyltransferase complex ATPase subunit type 1 TsaE [Candidatus Paceibacterota bacterium]
MAAGDADSDVVTKDELEAEAARLADEVRRAAPAGHAAVIALSGDLGSGKTTFAQAFARALGIEAHVTSPTFVIEKRYPVPQAGKHAFRTFVHVDAYRLDDPKELAQLGWHGTIDDPSNIVLIEWADKVASLLPDDAYRIALAFRDERTRTLTYGD